MTTQVELWLLDVRAPHASWDPDLLDAAERERAARFVREHDRVLYTAAHAALRTVLATRTGLSAAELRFERAPCPCCGALHGRPRLAAGQQASGRPAGGQPAGGQPAGGQPAPGVEFSLSHGGDLVLIGLADRPLGVDVERLPTPGTAAETAVSLHPAERAELASAPAGTVAETFARLWTRKEAYLKGLGTGLGRDLAADYLGESDPAALPPGWTVSSLPAGPTHAAAVAVASPQATFTLRTSLAGQDG